MKLRTTLLTPGWHRSVLLRRLLSALLIVCAIALMAQSLFTEKTPVVVLTRDVIAGRALEATDLEERYLSTDLIPDNSLREVDAAVGTIVASSLSKGEILTQPRLLDSELLNDFVINNSEGQSSEQGNMVPLKLADPAVIPLLHHGDRISVVAHDPESAQPHVIAAGGTVIVAGADGTDTVLVTFPESMAHRVAAMSLNLPLAVVITGDRSRE